MTWSAEHSGASGNLLRWMLVVEGLPYVWVSESGEQRAFTRTVAGVTHVDVTGWFSTYLNGREVRAGLEAPSVSCGLDPGTGQLRADQVTFKIQDLDGSLALLFGKEPPDEDVQILRETIEAGTDALSTVTGFEGVAIAIDVTSKHIGIEAIGPSGERNYRPCLPIEMPGPKHSAPNPDTDVDAAPITITAEPLAFEGRKVTLWALWPDKDAADQDDILNWGTWHDHHESGRSLVWWGKLRDRPEVGADRVWSIPCNGPRSWLEKMLNQGPWVEWATVMPGSLTLGDDERGFAVRFHQTSEFNVGDLGDELEHYGGSRWDSTYDMPASGTADDYIEAIRTALDAVKEGGGACNIFTSDGPFTQGPDLAQKNDVGIDREKIWLKSLTYDLVNNDKRIQWMGLVLHRKVWNALGYNVDAHIIPGATQGGATEDGWVPGGSHDWDWDPSVTSPAAAPPPDYWELEMDTFGALSHASRGEVWMRPDVPNGAPVVRAGGTMRLIPAGGGGRLMLTGQNLQAPSPTATLEDGATTYQPDRVRLFAIRGKIRAPTTLDSRTVEDREVTRVFVGEWQDDTSAPGCLREGDGGGAMLRIVRWLDARMFGVQEEPLELVLGPDPVLISDRFEVVPLGTVGRPASTSYLGSRIAWLTLLCSTGTSPGYVGGFLQDGDNPIEGLTLQPRDVEQHEFGLGIPASMIQDEPSFRGLLDAAAPVDGGTRWWRYARSGPFSSLDVLESLCGGVGLGWSLDGNRYQVFDRFAPPGHDEVEVEILQTDTTLPRQGAPIGRFSEVEIAFRGGLEGGTTETRRIQSRDRGAAARGKLVHKITDIGAMPGRGDVPSWFAGADQRWAVQAAEFWGRRLFLVQNVTVPADKALRLRVGSVVRFTNSAILDPSTGTYGISNAVARVMAWKLDGFATAALDLLVFGESAAGAKAVWAPWGLTVRAGYDSTTRRLLLQRDPWDSGDTGLAPTCRGFVRPSWASSLEGTGVTEIALYEQDRAGLFPAGPTGTVESIDEAANAITIAAPGLSEAPLRDKTYFVVLQPYANQEAWAQQLYAWVTDPDGTHSSGVPGRRLR